MGDNFTIVLLACVLGGLPSLATAATDGRAGPTSVGSLQISLNVDPKIRLSNLQDVQLVSRGGQLLSANRDVCIYSRTGQYQLQAQGSGIDAAFALNQAGAAAEQNQWTYQVQYSDGSGLIPISSGVPLAGLRGADSRSQNCDSTGPNGQLLISSRPNPGERQRTGHYTGVLTLLVAPE